MLGKLKSFKMKKQVTFLSLLLALAVAVFLNWQYARSDAGFRLAEENVVATELTVLPTDTMSNEEAESELQRNYGDAQLVGLDRETGIEYFEKARLERTKTRDEALEKLQSALADAKLTDEEKATLTQTLTTTIDGITAENEIETMVKAKGFVECVAIMDEETIDIAVMTKEDALTQAQVMQIRDIVMSKCDVPAQNIKIVEVK